MPKQTETASIPPREQVLLNALSRIGEKCYSMGTVSPTMDSWSMCQLANKAIEDWSHVKN